MKVSAAQLKEWVIQEGMTYPDLKTVLEDLAVIAWLGDHIREKTRDLRASKGQDPEDWKEVKKLIVEVQGVASDLLANLDQVKAKTLSATPAPEPGQSPGVR